MARATVPALTRAAPFLLYLFLFKGIYILYLFRTHPTQLDWCVHMGCNSAQPDPVAGGWWWWEVVFAGPYLAQEFILHLSILGLSLSLADSLRPDLIHEQPSKNRYSMFQENRCPLHSGENRSSPWPGDFTGVTQRAGGRARVTVLALVVFLVLSW